MTAEDFERIAARADLSRLLAACYYEPGPELAEEKVFESMLTAAARVDGELAAGVRRLGAAHAGEDHTALLVDYTRLFLGPVQARAKPYASAWLSTEQSVMQDVTVAVLDLYAQGGFTMADEFRDLPDHISAELEFLYLLLFKEAQAGRELDASGLPPVDSLRGRFVYDHLGRWIEPFCEALSHHAETGFYRELAAVTGRFVGLEMRGSPAS